MKHVTIFQAASLMLLFSGCSSNDDVGVLVDDFIPVISNAWQDTHSKDLYVLTSDVGDSLPQGTFTGSIQNPDSVSVPELQGSFVHEKIQFTITSGYFQGTTYKGVIDTVHPKTMLLANTADPQHDSLHLERP